MINEASITQLLEEAGGGDPGAVDQIVNTLYEDLRARARLHMRKQFGEAAGAVTMQPTALVNETYLRLLGQQGCYANQNHFLAIATRVMLRVLIDYQRARGAEKRGGGKMAVTLSGIDGDLGAPNWSVSEIERALDELDQQDPRKAEVVKLRAVWGFNMNEISAALNISLSTAEREWRFAKGWLSETLRSDSAD